MTQTATKTREAPNRRTASLPVRSKYDAAQTTGNNRHHWALADALSANAANSPEIRAIIRARARYEMANNSWAKGMALTLAKATIGKGPRTPNYSNTFAPWPLLKHIRVISVIRGKKPFPLP